MQRVEAAEGANPAPVVHTVGYTYTHGKLTALTYPSGGVLSIGYTQGQATSLSFAAARTLARPERAHRATAPRADVP